jgi:hypothetical protein
VSSLRGRLCADPVVLPDLHPITEVTSTRIDSNNFGREYGTVGKLVGCTVLAMTINRLR